MNYLYFRVLTEKSWAPSKCKIFIWLAIQNRCWTADRLQKRGLPHPAHCPLCDQEDETVQHLLTSCVFARQFWFYILQLLGLTNLVPSRRSISLADWWKKSWRKIPKQHKKGVQFSNYSWSMDPMEASEHLCFWWVCSQSAARTPRI